MNEQKYLIHIGVKDKRNRTRAAFGSDMASGYVKPHGKFWKRYFNKKVRNGKTHKRGNFFEWC